MKTILRFLPLPEASPAMPPHHRVSFPPIPLDEPLSVRRRGAQPRLSRSHRIPKHASKLEYLHPATASPDTGAGAGVRFVMVVRLVMPECQEEREEQQSELAVCRLRPLGWAVVGLVSFLSQLGDVESVFGSEEG
ncbi:hypothetical protein Ddye_014552 [Dipteronia dyeriana]|uniref:Uncharacterized protein n=1 Tax=Dipteronia dyeriana TaxID=168575 RepID=A0AAD9X8K3_9ROSI|nr:hypothetical protein Ddye_014552 [Dipteronia dyeriana]